jgi:hypothetical protein
LTEAERALTSTVSLDAVLRLTTERAARLGTDRAVLMLSDADGVLTSAAFGLERADRSLSRAARRLASPATIGLAHVDASATSAYRWS